MNAPDFLCPLCARDCPAAEASRHHVLPKSQGGREIAVLCRDCHRQIHRLFKVKDIARRLNTLSNQHAITLSGHNPTEHATSILALDTQKFKVAKEASDLEIEGARLDQELCGLDKQLKELEGRREGEGREMVEGSEEQAM